ncbi:MAG: hypothetical protein WAO83_11375 [Fuerstiella sp.]
MSRCSYGLLMISLLIAAGCGGGGASGGKPVFLTKGKVTMFGAPLADATVAFAPTEQGQPTAIGRTDAQGQFVLTTYDYGDGAAAGSYKVVLSKPIPTQASSTESADAGDDGHEQAYSDSNSHSAASAESAAGGAGLVPPEYSSSTTTPLTAEVKSSGDNDILLEIK